MIGAAVLQAATLCSAAASENFGPWERPPVRQFWRPSRQECGQNMVTVGKKA
jgi:hypothetical protein